MTELQALLLGIIQGLTEFLPVSSSGHLEIGHALLGIEDENSLLFVLTVHVATVLSTILVFRKDIATLCKDLFAFQWNESNRIYQQIAVFFYSDSNCRLSVSRQAGIPFYRQLVFCRLYVAFYCQFVNTHSIC